MAANTSIPIEPLSGLVSAIGAPAAILFFLWWTTRGDSRPEPKSEIALLRADIMAIKSEVSEMHGHVQALNNEVIAIRVRQEERGK